MDPQRLIPGDATLIETIVNYLKAKGIFDEFRHECLADVDTKSSCQNLSQRVDGYTSKFLGIETWNPDLNKNELRNKLRRNIDGSGMLIYGADHVVEQAINPKIHQLFLPKIIEVVHQYIKEQKELLIKKPEAISSDNTSCTEKVVCDTTDSKTKTSVSKDPIADILSFTKSKPTASTSIHVKTENIQQKHNVDLPKLEKKKEEKPISVPEKSTLETPSEITMASTATETKPQIDKEKEKIKKEDNEISQEISKKVIKEELKPEKKKNDDTKLQCSEISSTVEEHKVNVSAPVKPSLPGKKDFDKNKQKVKSSNPQKSSTSSSEIKKPKKESSDKSLEKHIKSKPTKSVKDSPSPTKSISSIKSVSKEEKIGESSKSKSSDSSSSKTSESSVKKISKSSSIKKDNSSKHKGHSEKAEKSKISKSVDKSDQTICQDSSNSEKSGKTIQYSSSYDSSQGSDQEKSSSSSSKKERQKHFSKHAKKEKAEEIPDKNIKSSCDKKRPKDADESASKKAKNEKSFKLKSSKIINEITEKLKDTTVVEAAKISSRSNSFGSTSSVSSSSNTSKDNLVSNSDEVSESSVKDKKKKQVKEKDSCHNVTLTLPPPPPPPPPASSLSCELTSSAEMSSMEDTQSSSDSEGSSSGEIHESSSSHSELESKDSVLNTLNEHVLNSSTNNKNSFYYIFLEPSSSSEFEGFESSPEDKEDKKTVLKDGYDSDLSVSSVHTSDLSSFDDEISDEDFSLSKYHFGVKKRLTLNEVVEIFQKKTVSNCVKRKTSLKGIKSNLKAISPNDGYVQRCLSSIEKLHEEKKTEETIFQDKCDSDVTVSSVHTSDLSSFEDELTVSEGDDSCSESHEVVKKRISLKEAQDIIQNRAASKKSQNLLTENKPSTPPAPVNERYEQKPAFLSSDEELSPSEPKRLLRRERKLNPRYASSEYTSIFNSRKETFITKQSSPSVRSNSVNSSPNSDTKLKKKESLLDKAKMPIKSSVEAKIDAMHQDEIQQPQKTKNVLHHSKSCNNEKDLSDKSDISSSDEVESIMDKEKVFQENDKPADNSDTDHLKIHLTLKLQNNSKLNMNSYSLKRKLAISESPPVKRPCSRSSVDSTNSEFVPNENKPFNSEKQSLDDKILRDNNLRGSDLTDGIRKDLFCKQRTNNNGDLTGQKDIFPKNSHGKTTNNSEKKTSESDTSKELNAL